MWVTVMADLCFLSVISSVKFLVSRPFRRHPDDCGSPASFLAPERNGGKKKEQSSFIIDDHYSRETNLSDFKKSEVFPMIRSRYTKFLKVSGWVEILIERNISISSIFFCFLVFLKHESKMFVFRHFRFSG